jgi:hypothetical protein
MGPSVHFFEEYRKSPCVLPSGLIDATGRSLWTGLAQTYARKSQRVGVTFATIIGYDREDAMNRSILESDVARRSSADNVAEAASGCPADLISDDDLPWDEVMADLSSGVRGYEFDPADYPSDEAMMAAAEALLLKWWEEGADEE